jgi:hypothetical protein
LKKIPAYNFLGIIGLLLFGASFFVPFNIADIQIQGKYFVFEMDNVFRTVACTLLALFTIYTFSKRILYSNSLSWMHVILTLLSLTVFIILIYGASEAYRPGFSAWSSFEKNNRHMIITLMLFLLAQVLFLINILAGTFKLPKRLNGN